MTQRHHLLECGQVFPEEPNVPVQAGQSSTVCPHCTERCLSHQLTAWYTYQFEELSEETLYLCAQLDRGKPTTSCSCRAFAVPAGNNCVLRKWLCRHLASAAHDFFFSFAKIKVIVLKFRPSTFVTGGFFH